MSYDKQFLTPIINQAIGKINNGISKTLTARRSDEIPPASPRHLTDTRTRVSTLLEYSLSYELNHILMDKGGDETISNVLWNVFPDLIVRNKQRENIMGLEIKALHTAAEEKSANLSTPLPLIRKGKDFVVILIWGWVEEELNAVSITYPHIHAVGIFDAWLLAKIRDMTWLINTGNRIEGIDISTPILDGDTDMFKAEEGNLGKLMRIHMSEHTSKNTPYYAEMLSEANDYANFTSETLYLGVCETSKDISNALNGTLTFYNKMTQFPENVSEFASIHIGSQKITIVAGPKRGDIWMKQFPTVSSLDRLFYLDAKLQWTIYSGGKEWKLVSSGKKPDIELKKICDGLTNLH